MNSKEKSFFSDHDSLHSIENEENSDENGSESFDMKISRIVTILFRTRA